MNKLHLTEKEEELMRHFWERGPMFVRELIDLLPEPKPHFNTVSTFVNLLDNLMVGQIGTEQMSGVSIVNQILFVVNLCIFGGVGGSGI
ncbi:MAG: BlaI/MecI/CopY family transcriptional regulator, partial [Muribaculaceae bacterium]|nr:BlaI/MecI/CopY family transcriptional regulator [Muribaculaceae bacterium]